MLEKYAARYQVSYPHNSLTKTNSVTIQACSTRLEKINGLLQHFPGPENKPLSEGDLIGILVNMAPAQWHKNMTQICLEHIQKTLTEVVEYLKCLGVLDTTEKKTDAQKRVMINQKIRLNTNLIIEPADKGGKGEKKKEVHRLRQIQLQ